MPVFIAFRAIRGTPSRILGLKSFHYPVTTCCLCLPDNRRVFSASSRGSNRLWEIGRELATLEGHTTNVACLSLNGEATRLVSASYDETLKVWEVSHAKSAWKSSRACRFQNGSRTGTGPCLTGRAELVLRFPILPRSVRSPRHEMEAVRPLAYTLGLRPICSWKRPAVLVRTAHRPRSDPGVPRPRTPVAVSARAREPTVAYLRPPS
jgi:hypothetical protein